MHTTSYNKLCTEFYDATKPEATKAEVDFYAQQLHAISGPLLEAMCGSGRLLLPLLKQGIKIEGVDYSAAMLESCKKRAAQHNLSPVLYQQNILELVLSKQYAAIIIAYGSFQLLSNRNEALQALIRLHQHLLPGGILLLDTFIPRNFITQNQKNYSSTRTAFLCDDTHITLNSTSTFDFKNQLCHDQTTYQKIHNNQVTETEIENITITWYQENELKSLLATAGFSAVSMQTLSFYDDSLLYKAHK